MNLGIITNVYFSTIFFALLPWRTTTTPLALTLAGLKVATVAE